MNSDGRLSLSSPFGDTLVIVFHVSPLRSVRAWVDRDKCDWSRHIHTVRLPVWVFVHRHTLLVCRSWWCNIADLFYWHWKSFVFYVEQSMKLSLPLLTRIACQVSNDVVCIDNEVESAMPSSLSLPLSLSCSSQGRDRHNRDVRYLNFEHYLFNPIKVHCHSHLCMRDAQDFPSRNVTRSRKLIVDIAVDGKTNIYPTLSPLCSSNNLIDHPLGLLSSFSHKDSKG